MATPGRRLPAPGVIGRRYSPLLVLAAIQLMLVLLSPSVPRGSAIAGGGGVGPGTAGTTQFGSASGNSAVGSESSATNGGVLGGSTGPGATALNAAGSAGGSTGGPGSGAGAATVGAVEGATGPQDLSHCTKTGRQIGPTFYMPPCVPVWHGGDNGGSTMTGITANRISYVYYIAQGNAEVNAILNQEGLAATPDQTCQAAQAFDAEINKRWEHYGRTFVSLNGPGNHSGYAQERSCHFPFFQGQCSLTPPDPPCERAEADLIASTMRPAYVMAPVADPAFYNELGKDHIIVAGGENEPATYHSIVAPFYYDTFINGERAMGMAAEYYCKRLYNKPVQWAGPDVEHPDGNPLGKSPRRKIAIVFPATNGDPTATISANEFVHNTTGGECGAASDGVKEYPYQSDITTAQQQSNTLIGELKASHVTTVVFFGDPIAPVFLSNTADSQGYHPEFLLTGTGLVDYDVLGQLYNKNVWQHAFGVSSLANSIPFSQTDAVKAAHDVGAATPDTTENLAWTYYTLMATSFQVAGSHPTPSAIQSGLFGLQPLPSDPLHPLIWFGHPNDYTGIQDMREVYWCNTAVSPINNQPGEYVWVDGGVRRQLGQWPTTNPAVFPHGFC
jgi:hypothetical protein